MKRRTFLAAGSTVFVTSLLAKNPPLKLRVGVIGHTGRGNYGHGLDTVWLKVPETEIVAVADPHENGLANACKTNNTMLLNGHHALQTQVGRPFCGSALDGGAPPMKPVFRPG